MAHWTQIAKALKTDFNRLNATVKGTDDEGKAFETELKFTLIPPKEGTAYYGTGYYMLVEMPESKEYVDVRYKKTTDIEILADRFIESYFGENAKEVEKEFATYSE